MLSFFTAILVGTLLPAQSAINSKLRSFVNSPLFASMISSIIATIFLIFLAVIFGAIRRKILKVQIVGMIVMIAGVILIEL